MTATVELKFRVSRTGSRGPPTSPIVNIPAVSPTPNNIYASTTPSSELYPEGQTQYPPSYETPPQYPAPIPGSQDLFGQGIQPFPSGYPLPPPGELPPDLDFPNWPSPPVPVPQPYPLPYPYPGYGSAQITHITVPNTIVHGQNFQIKTMFRNVGQAEATFKVTTNIPSLSINNVISNESISLRPGEEGIIAVTLQMTDIVCITTPCDTGGPYRGTLVGTSTVMRMLPTGQYQADDSKNWNYDGGGVAIMPIAEPVIQPHPVPGPELPPPPTGSTATASTGGGTATTATAGGGSTSTSTRSSVYDYYRQLYASRLQGLRDRYSSRAGFNMGDKRLGGTLSMRTYSYPWRRGWIL